MSEVRVGIIHPRDKEYSVFFRPDPIVAFKRLPGVWSELQAHKVALELANDQTRLYREYNLLPSASVIPQELIDA